MRERSTDGWMTRLLLNWMAKQMFGKCISDSLSMPNTILTLCSACVIFELMANGAPDTLNGAAVVNRNLQGEDVLQHMFWPALGHMNVPMNGLVNAWPEWRMPTIYFYNGTGLPHLIRTCLNWNRDLRPTLVELRNQIDDVFQNHPEWEVWVTSTQR